MTGQHDNAIGKPACSPLVIAHRGMSKKYPENTILSIKQALLCADIVEIDVRLSKDNVVVLMHDRRVDRTCLGHSGKVDQLTWDKLKSMDCGSFLDSKFSDVRIATLREVLELFTNPMFNPKKKKIMIEMKYFWFTLRDGFISPIRGLSAEVANLVKEYKAWDVCIVQSFSSWSLEVIRRIDSRIETCDLAFPWKPLGSLMKKDLGNSCNIFHGAMSQEACKKLIDSGKLVYAYVVDDRGGIISCVKCGLAGIVTNVPDEASAILKELDPQKLQGEPVPWTRMDFLRSCISALSGAFPQRVLEFIVIAIPLILIIAYSTILKEFGTMNKKI